MNDKIFKEKINLIDESVKQRKFEETIPIFQDLHSALLPNDLTTYLSIKSLHDTIKSNRDIEFVLKEVSDIKARLQILRLPERERISNFVTSVVSYTIIPVVPFFANWLNGEETTNKDVVLSLAMYNISIALSLKSARDRILGILFSITIFLLVDKEPKPNAVFATYLLTLVTVLLHFADRYYRHLKYQEPYI